jgi:hypothetical protein
MTLRDFRPHIQGPKALTEADLLTLCRRGELARVIAWLKRNRYDLAKYRGLIDTGVRTMVRKHRANEVLSILFKNRIQCEYEVKDLLRMTLAQGDVPGFLKQASRFQVIEGLDSEIDRALEWLDVKKQLASADAYRRRFAVLRARNDLGPTRST